MVHGPAWDGNLCVSVGQGVAGWQLEVPGGAEQLGCIQDGLATSLCWHLAGQPGVAVAVQAIACAATGSACATPTCGSARQLGMCIHHKFSAAVLVAGLRQCSSGCCLMLGLHGLLLVTLCKIRCSCQHPCMPAGATGQIIWSLLQGALLSTSRLRQLLWLTRSALRPHACAGGMTTETILRSSARGL